MDDNCKHRLTVERICPNLVVSWRRKTEVAIQAYYCSVALILLSADGTLSSLSSLNLRYVQKGVKTLLTTCCTCQIVLYLESD